MTEMIQIAREQYDLLDLLPDQGNWNTPDYLWLSGKSSRLIELVDGRIEVLVAPTEKHQSMLIYMFLLFRSLIAQIGGKVAFAPLRLQLWDQRFREPDVLLVLERYCICSISFIVANKAVNVG